MVVAGIVVLNAGSSSLKVARFGATGETCLAAAESAWGEDGAGEGAGGDRRGVLDRLLGEVGGERGAVAAVGHRVVHGGGFPAAVVVDEAVKREIGRLGELAPLHNPVALELIEAVGRALPGVPQVAAFDTAFHAGLPPSAAAYAVPHAWSEEWGVRRFGFHGLSHAYCAGRAAELLGRAGDGPRLVTCHLGAGCSLAAVAGGRSVATTMGFTPLDGLVMATRSGAVDPGLLLHLLERGRLGVAALRTALERESGLRGVSGLSGEMRELLAARAAGHERAGLAFDLYVARLGEGIAAMASHLGGLDALVFAGGVGEHAAAVRAAACGRLGWLGIALDGAANAAAVADVDVAAAGSAVRVLVVRTREDLMVARETRRLVLG